MKKFQTADVKKKYLVYYKIANYYRNKRFNFFLKVMNVNKNSRILDVGGTFDFWEDLDFENVTLLNIIPQKSNFKIKAIIYGGGCFPFDDFEFDVVFSNSVIEHLGDFLDQKLFATEVQRVSKRYFLQTPSFWFPYEPHAIMPFF